MENLSHDVLAEVRLMTGFEDQTTSHECNMSELATTHMHFAAQAKKLKAVPSPTKKQGLHVAAFLALLA